MFSVQGKVAVITGGTSGIGLATVRRFAAAGASVIAVARGPLPAEVQSESVTGLRVDVTDGQSLQRLAEYVRERYGRVDVLVASAGRIDPRPFDQDEPANYADHFDLNCLGFARTVRALLPIVVADASLVAIGSLAGMVGFPTYGAYGASKAALASLTRTLAVELAPRGVRVNCICPGTVATPMATADGTEAELAFVRTAACLGRMATAEEIAAVAHFLASDDCRYLTGQSLVVDGGLAGLYGWPLVAAASATTDPTHCSPGSDPTNTRGGGQP